MARRTQYSKGTIGLLIFAVIMTPLLVGLGLWQLSRADEKKAIITQQVEGDKEEVIQLENLTAVDWKTQRQAADIWNYKKVVVNGRYDKTVYLLIDNRTRNGKVGYEVINLFRTDDGKAIWVNRGWVKAPMYRDQWPTVDKVTARVALTGTLYIKSDQDFTLASAPVTKNWPRRVQGLDINALEAELKHDAYPFTLRLIDDEQAGALQTGWRVAKMSPDKHLGYAVQWFSLAVVLVVMTIIAVGKNNTTEVEQADES